MFILLAATLFAATLGERILLRILNSLPVSLNELFSVVFIYLLLETNFMVGIAVAIKLIEKWVDQQNEKHEAEKQNLKSELNILKAQLHPHFLFNTMNNLYALSVENSSKTSEGIAKISDLLRSVLYECDETEFELAKEINLIDNYIGLEKMRYGDRLDVSFEKKGNPEGHRIAPMLLFTFVENCFKHGSNPAPDKSWIKLRLVSENDRIVFEAFNSKPEETFQIPKSKGHGASGVGLNNVRKRLEILYENHYSLSVTEEKNSFKLNLEIWRK